MVARILGALASLAALSTSAYADATWTATPFNPPSVPLAVRTPYLSAWLPQGAGTALYDAWPTFWTGSILGWAGYIRVDGTTYNFLGDPAVSGAAATKAVQKSFSFTATQSVFVLTAGPVDLTATFLSPVEPNDLTQQSLPFSYLALSAASNDGGSHSVHVYTDISAEWVSGDNSLTANWTTTAAGDVLTHQVQLENQSVYGEVSDHIQQGSAYYSTTSSPSTTYQTGQDVVVRAQFINSGALANTQDTNFRAISDNWPVFAFAHDLGTVSGPTDPVVFTVGHARDPAVEYIVAGGASQDRSIYFWSQFPSVADVISSFIGDYADALSRAKEFDAQVDSDASKISADYSSIVALSVRQTFGATEITISKGSNGQWNTSDVLVFMKEISSDGNVNTVDVIFPAWPAFLYANPALGKSLLLPLFEYQATGQYPNKYSVHDMGAHYPQALGHNDGKDEPMPLEESGNMLIMTLSYTQKSNDTSLITTYSGLLDQWTQFLIAEALIPADQISTDDFAGSLANQTNLAIKGIVGIRAMAEIASLLGDDAKSQNYSVRPPSLVLWLLKLLLMRDIGWSPRSVYRGELCSAMADACYVKRWETSNALAGAYRITSTPTNFLDCTSSPSPSTTPSPPGTKQCPVRTHPSPSPAHRRLTSHPAELFGVPLDTRHTYTKTDWQIFTAGMLASTSTTTRDLLISRVRAYAGVALGSNTEPFGDWYETTDGAANGFRARPVVGGHLALVSAHVRTIRCWADKSFVDMGSWCCENSVCSISL
ncbi:hypothetical protein EW146_g5515 [Bondarzewia mesenterica]|uniref:DUF1793-domain-containing protein n=1 Tax=Bondarzewia mesenterica TaxID=1095465 RepID=A0A4S4LRB3_9AGAM|nr:hypothetical protein EW146_g5515 [Bondarzewia mesenterica]